MMRAVNAVRCDCGCEVELTPATLVAYVDEDGFRSNAPTHALLNCLNHPRHMQRTFSVALASEAA